jgi:hypothetical protein
MSSHDELNSIRYRRPLPPVVSQSPLSLLDRLCFLTCALVLATGLILAAYQNAAMGERSIEAQLQAQRELIQMQLQGQREKM